MADKIQKIQITLPNGKQQWVTIPEFNNSRNSAYAKAMVRMIDNEGNEYDVEKTSLNKAHKLGLRAFIFSDNAPKPQPTAQQQPTTTAQPTTPPASPTKPSRFPSFDSVTKGFSDYGKAAQQSVDDVMRWNVSGKKETDMQRLARAYNAYAQDVAKGNEQTIADINKRIQSLPTMLSDRQKQQQEMQISDRYFQNEAERLAYSEAEAERIQKELADANAKANALRQQIADKSKADSLNSRLPFKTGAYYGGSLPDAADPELTKQLNEQINRITSLSQQLNKNEAYQRNLQALENTARELGREGAIEAQQKDSQSPWFNNPLANPYLGSNERVNPSVYQMNKKQNQAATIGANVNTARTLLREASLSNDSFYKQLGRGMLDAAFDINTWDAGLTAVNQAATTLMAKQAYDKGKATAADMAVLESSALKNVIASDTRKAISAWYNAGITTTNMIPFMAYIMASPFNNVGRAFSASVGKAMLNKSTVTLMRKGLSQSVYRASIAGLKGIGRFAGDVVGGSATALTFGNQVMLGDAINRYQGQHTGQFNAEGRFVYTGSKDAKGIPQSLLEAFATQAIEYQSELVGEYFTPVWRALGKGIGKGAGKALGYTSKEWFDAAGNKTLSRSLNLMGHKISLDKTVDLFSRLSNKESVAAFNKFLKSTKQNGILGEYLEEVIGNMENATLGINNANWGTGEGGVFNPEENMETFLAVAVGTGFLSGIGGLAGASHRSMLNRAYNRANKNGMRYFGWDSWVNIREQIDNAAIGELPNVVTNLMKGMNERQAKTVQNYAAFSVAKQGSLIADFKEELEKPHIARVSVDNSDPNDIKVTSFDEQNKPLSVKSFKTEEDAMQYQEMVHEYINNGKNMQVLNELLATDTGFEEAMRIVNQMNDAAEQIGIDPSLPMDLNYITNLFYKDPLKRTDFEQHIVDSFVAAANNVAFPSNEVNTNHEHQQGRELADGSEIGDQASIDTVNQRETAAIERWNNIADPDLKSSIATLVSNGLNENQIMEYLRQNEYSEDIIEAFAELCNAKAFKDGFIANTGIKISEEVQRKVSSNTFSGQLNGEESPIIISVQDQNGTPLFVVGGNISLDEQGILSSDGLVILRDEQGNFIQRQDMNGLTLLGTQTAEDYQNTLLTQTQEAVTAQIQSTEAPIVQDQSQDPSLQPPTQDLQPPTSPTNTQPQEQQQQQSPSIPVDENNNPLYHKAPIEATVENLYNGELDEEDIPGFITANINDAFSEYDKLSKKKPKITSDKAKYVQAKKDWQQKLDEAKQKLDYWHNVEQYIQQQTYTTDAEIKSAQDELSGANAQAEFAAENGEGAKTPVQVAGEFIKDAKLLSDDFRKETGLSRKEELQFPGMFAKDGKTIAQLAEALVSHDNDTYNGMFFKGDDMAAKDAIIEALQTAGGRASLGRNTSAEFEAFDRERTQQREDFYEEAYHMSYSDYLAFEEQQMPSIWRRISNFAPEQYDQMVAEYYESLPEDYFTHQNQNNNGTEQQNPPVAGSNEILPQPPTNNETGTGQRQDPAAEGGNGGKGDNTNDEVPGGTPGNINNQTGEEQSQWNTLSEEKAKAIIQNMENSAEEYVETELSPESWNNSFDENNTIETPIGRVKMGDNQISKFLQKKRTKEFGMVAPTLSNPDVIVEERSEAKDGNTERATSYIFIKTFNRNGEKIKFYASITVKKDGMEVSISSHYMNKNAVEKRLMEDNVIYIKDSLLPNSSDMHLAENPKGLPDLLPTQESNESISGDKDTTKSPNSQENQQKTDEKSDEGQKDDVNAEIKKDIEAFIAESTHDVQITNYDEENYEAQISVDSKPSNIVVTPPMEMEEGMHAEYRPGNSSYQELGDLLDEYNKTVDRKDQGLDGEHLAAIFSSVDGAIAFENWINKKKTEKQESPLSTQAKRLLNAIDKGDVNEMSAAKKEISNIINGMSHSELSNFAYNKNQLVKNQDTRAKKEVYKYICNEAKKRADSLVDELNRKIQDKYPGVNVVYDSGSFWITASKDSKYKKGIESLDNDRRWLNENSVDSSSVPSLHEDSMNDWIKAIDARLSEVETEKTWDDMTEEERMQYAFSQPLLTEEEINNAPTDDVNKANALAFVKGQESMITKLSYYLVYTDVKHSTGSSLADNEAGGTSQLDETAGRGSTRGRTEGMRSGLRDMSVGTTDSGQTYTNQGREQLLRGENGEGRPADDTGEGSNQQVPGDQQPVGRPDSRSDKPGRGSVDNGNGHNVSQQGGNGRSRKNPDSDRRRTDKTDRAGDTGNAELNSESIDAQIEAELGKFSDLLSEYRNAKKGNGGIIMASAIGIPINQKKIEIFGKLIYQGAKIGYLMLRKGLTSLAEWSAAMRKILAPQMREAEISDTEIDEFIKEMWHCNLPIDGETHTIAEWSKIMQQEKLREIIRTSLEEKRKKQLEAEPIEVKIADKNNIEQTLPYLLPLQQDDVYKAEMQFFDESHNDRQHAYGKGFMFTNGTGTGKTYTGLGIAKRFIKQGKGRILILTPSTTKVDDWVKDAANLNIEANDLEKWAKNRKQVPTASKGEGVVVTTYANFRQNQALLEDEFDLVIYDESHRLLENKKGGETEGSKQHYMLTNKNEMWAFNRLQKINPVYNEIQRTREKYDEEYDKEKAKFPDEKDAKMMLPMLGESIGVFPAAYPNLKAIKQKYDNLVKQYNDEVKPQLEAQAKESVKKTKVVFLSATPFNTKENLGYTESYIFSYPEENGGRIGARSQFYLDTFGAAYRWRYNRLETRSNNPDAVAKQEVAFSDYLQNTLGTMSGRVIDSEFDYSRDFPTATLDRADELNKALNELAKEKGIISKAYWTVMGDYNYTSALFEAMKVSCILPRMKAHLDAGRKIVLFHRRMETSRPIDRPFRAIYDTAMILAKNMTNSAEKKDAIARIEEMKDKYSSLFDWEETLDLRVPRAQIADAFGLDSILFFSGKETSKQKKAAVAEFNNDNSNKKIIIIQEASGKEGISLHDTTGKNQRVLISLAMPQSPITALQVEGRIYRIGNKSNAIFEYPLLGLDHELIVWGQRFNAQIGTTENLALGTKARNLRESFAKSVIEHSGDVPLDGQGIGGKELDEAVSQDTTDPFDRAVLDFYANQRLSGRRDNREGKDYYPTPEPLGFMMVEWANLNEGESALEPSAGHGAIARYVPYANSLMSIEPSASLFGKLQVQAGGIGRKFKNTIFEDYDIINKHDAVIMNPPFGSGGRLAVDHVAKAFQHLSEGGRIVAIIPRGSTDSKFDKWIESEKNAALVGEIQLPNITFQNAGTQVNTRVVIIDKISNEKMRNEALGNKKTIELPNNYEKIEDFFGDLRGISMPPRTIDQKTKNDRKIMPIIKELKDDFGDKMTVEFTPTGVLLSGAGFDYLNLKGNELKLHVAAQYARANKILKFTPEKMTRVIGAYEAIKKMALKLADMSAEEMDKFVKENIKDSDSNKTIAQQFTYAIKQNTRTGELMHVVTKNRGVNLTEDEYTKVRDLAKNNGGYWSKFLGGFVFESEIAAKSFLNGGNVPAADNESTRLAYSNSTNNVNNSRIIPEDVDKSVSLQIENEFDSAIDNATKELSEKDKRYVMSTLLSDMNSFAHMQQWKLEEEYKYYKQQVEQDERRNQRNLQVQQRTDRRTVGGISEAQDLALLACIERERSYRERRAVRLSESLGLTAGKPITIDELDKIYKQINKDPRLNEIFDKTISIAKRLGSSIEVSNEDASGKGNFGESGTKRDLHYYIEAFCRTASSEQELPVVILHELIHQATTGAISIVKKGKAEGILTKQQIDAVNTIFDIYNKSLNNKNLFSENDRGLLNEYEFAAQMADPRQRRALQGFDKEDLSVLDRIIRAAKQLKSQGDTSLWDRIKKAIKTLLNIPDALDKMDEAIDTLLDTFNENVNDILMNDIDQNKWGYTSTQLFDKYPTWLSGQTTGTGQHTTQITSTVNTYKKIGEWMKSQGMDGASVLDASSGLGKGTEALRDMGFNVEDVEPYPSENRTAPTYLKYEDIKGKYDVVISNAVLNVIPDDWRADVLKNMADKVKPGGKMIINVRDAKEMERQKQKIELDSPSEILVTDKAGNIRAYQKGFTQKELADWIQSELGEGWTIETAKPSNSGISGRAVVVTRNTDTSLIYRKVTDSMQPTLANQERQSQMRAHAESIADKLNTKLTFTTSDKLEGEKKNAKGWYNKKTGQVVIVLDNNKDNFDIEQTVIHETVGHKGLRSLLGAKGLYRLLDTIYDNLDEQAKQAINERTMRNGWQKYTAIEEYLAEQAENTVWDSKSASLWQNVKHYLTEALRTLGFMIRPNLKDARYWLWLSKNNLKRSDVMSEIKRNALLNKIERMGAPKIADANAELELSPNELYRAGKYVDTVAFDAIEQRLKTNSFYWKEAYFDYMESYKVFQTELEKGLKNGLMDNMNAYLGENQLSSSIAQQQEDFLSQEVKALEKIINDLKAEFGEGAEGIDNLENYLMMKSGLERNRVIFMRDWFNSELKKTINSSSELSPEAEYIYEKMEQAIWQDFDDGNITEEQRDKQLKQALQDAHAQYLDKAMNDFNSLRNYVYSEYENQRMTLKDAYKQIDDLINSYTDFDPNKNDKSGLSALTQYFKSGKYEDEAIINEVQGEDRKINMQKANELMNAVQKVTQFALDQDYKNGLVTKEAYNRAKSMFRYYIPMRGFKETTMEDLYNYMTDTKGIGANSLIHAKGRKSSAASPLATAANMAMSAIDRGLKNQNKQRAYRAVLQWQKDNPNAKPPATVVDLWKVKDSTGDWVIKTPKVTDDMSAEEIRDEIERFNSEMKQLERQGIAKRETSPASFPANFTSKTHQREHMVPLMMNGKGKVIIFNGNPRPAQALRGELSSSLSNETSVAGMAIGKVNRFMASAFTSYNPTFMASNLFRDTGFANNNIASKESSEYLGKFTKNQVLLMTKDIGRYVMLQKNYQKGIPPRNEMEQYFYEFMKYGGKTGFVNQHDIAKLERMLIKNNTSWSAIESGANVIMKTGELIKMANDRVENINRFAAYMTSRQVGRSVMRSISDAKEVSVNFNRKGARGNTATGTNVTANMKFAGYTAAFAGSAYLFFNAGLQSMLILGRNYKKHKIRTLSYVVGIPMIFGALIIPMMNRMIAELCGDGDDDPYANLPEWTRRNNICIYLSHGFWLKIPLPIEIRAFYGIGDIAAGYLVDENLKSSKGIGIDILSQVSQILPVDFMGEGGGLAAALTPDALKPAVQLMTNTDWTGKPIWKEKNWDKFAPEYTKAFSGEYEVLVNMSKFINAVSGDSYSVWEFGKDLFNGDKDKIEMKLNTQIKGSFDKVEVLGVNLNNPAVWHAIIGGFGGGAAKTVLEGMQLLRRAITMDGEDFSAKEVPIVKALLDTPTEKTQYYRVLNKFYNYRDEIEEFDNNMKKWKVSLDPMEHSKYLVHTNKDKPTPEIIRSDMMRQYKRDERQINDVLKNPKLPEETQKTLKETLTRRKIELVKKLDNVE